MSPSAAVIVVVEDGVERVVGTLDVVDLGVVDALARLQLLARRLGCSIQLRDVDADLAGLLDLVGLAGVLAGESVSGIEVVGEPEG